MGFRLPDEPASPLRWAQLLDRASAEASVPAESVVSDGWVLRFSPLGFNRFSSVWPRAAGRGSTDARLEEAERFYVERGQVPRLVRSPASAPTDLSAALERRGWRISTTVDVLAHRVTPHASASIDPAIPPGVRLDIAEYPSAGFLGAWARSDMRVAGSPAEALRLVTPVDGGPVQRCISILDAQDACIGITRVVLGFGNSGLGIFGVWVEPAFRSRGLARWMCAAAVGLAAEFGAPRTWLQVEKGNAKAQRLYRALGYADCYAYECWVHPGPLDGEAVK